MLTWLEINLGLTARVCFLPDAAFLAREKARADAECYTAMKVAEANKVLCFPLWSLRAAPWHQAGRKFSAQEQAEITVEVKKQNKANN